MPVRAAICAERSALSSSLIEPLAAAVKISIYLSKSIACGLSRRARSRNATNRDVDRIYGRARDSGGCWSCGSCNTLRQPSDRGSG